MYRITVNMISRFAVKLDHVYNLPDNNKINEILKKKNIPNFIYLDHLNKDQIREFFLKSERLSYINKIVTYISKKHIESKEKNKRSPGFINQQYIYENVENKLYFGTENMKSYPGDKYTVDIYEIQYKVLTEFYYASIDCYYPEEINEILLKDNIIGDSEENNLSLEEYKKCIEEKKKSSSTKEKGTEKGTEKSSSTLSGINSWADMADPIVYDDDDNNYDNYDDNGDDN